MPSFLKDLRRKSITRKHPSADSAKWSQSNTSSNGTNKSSSTLNSFLGSSTPPSTLLSERSRSATNLPVTNGSPPPVPTRPSVVSSKSNRYSIVGPPTTNGQTRSMSSTSPLAPRVISISDNSWVHQKVFLIYGQIGDVTQPQDGHLIVCHHQDTFPQTNWPVFDSHFKALVHLQPGPNRIRLDYLSAKATSPNSQAHSSWININYLPLNASPPLHLVILLAKDSPETYDAVPERVQREGNGLPTAIRKYRMAAYLWQAFTGEQMNRNNFGRRCFRFEEEWQQGTLTYRDMDTNQMRNEAKVHVIRMSKSLKEIRDLQVAQQYEPAQRKGDLYSWAMDAVRAYFAPRPGQKQYVSCMYLDTHWDPQYKTVRGHAALGGGSDDLQLAIFGSHALQSYPASIEEVVPAFMDCTRTDMNYVANDLNESGSNWEAANIGIGAHMHETGHLLGCPHQESGVMLRDYIKLNRTFVAREAFATRTKSPGQRLCLPKDECTWHRLDTLRFRFHPCFRLPTDPLPNQDDSVQVWTVDVGNVLATAASGIAWIELFAEGDDVCHAWIEYIEPGSTNGPPRQVSLAEGDLRSRLPEKSRNKKLKIDIFSAGGGKHAVDDFALLASKASRVKLPDGRAGFRGSKLGFSQQDGTQPCEVLLHSAFQQTKLLRAVRVYSGFCLDGVEFVYEDSTTQLFGKRGGKPGGSEFALDTRRGEILMGFYVRAGVWIDGLQILTSLGRKSEIFGNATGGSGHTLIPPRGYSIAGIYGTCGQWVDGFGMIITR
ncbi:MAG: hypothetical protein M1822_004571 [Bathelium mastoideum]|nr:MAG: hypothetical protein M1822_004571 [Bathelium mastoideum]